MQKFIGQFTRFIYRNQETKFFVALFKSQKNEELDAHSFAVSGNKDLEIGVKCEITVTKILTGKYAGGWTLQSLQEILPDTTQGIINYLSSAKFPGIGKKAAELIVEKLGVKAIEKIKNDPNVLDDKELKLTIAKKATIINSINENDVENELIFFFENNNLPPATLNKIINKITAQVYWEKYDQNPYLLWLENDFFNFNEVNDIARAKGIDQAQRIKYIVLDILFNGLWDIGSTKMSLFLLFKLVNRVYPLSKESYTIVLKDLIELNLIKAFEIYVTPMKFYEKELFIKNYLLDLKNKEVEEFKPKKIDSYFDAIQKKAILGGIKNNVAIITGQPGTGKTEILKAILKEINSIYSTNRVAILAPTGRAAYQITTKSGYSAKTIHSFLGWQFTHFSIDAKNIVKIDVLVVDEFSMVDTNLFFALLSGIDFESIKKIILIGDKDQIPSIGEGYILNDLIDSQQFEVFKLKNNYRQLKGSNVFGDANLINSGKIPVMNYDDCYFIQSSNQNFKDDLEKTFKKFYEDYDIEDITILAPMYEGSTGIHWINSFIQKKVFQNKDLLPIMIGNREFYIGDKVIQLENDINANVFNGEIGYIENIIFFKEKVDFIIVRFPNNKLVKYTLGQWNKNIALAYAISIHKFQGSESLVVIMILFQAHSVLLNKKLFYTGITRARNNIVIIGERSAIQQAVEKDVESDRLTNLQDLLKK